MSESGPPVDLARGDRVASYRVTTVLGYGREGVAAAVTDEFLDLKRVLKAYPAEPWWIGRLRYVAHRFTDLAELGLAPRPLAGGVGLSSRSTPLAYLVFERMLGRPLDRLLAEGNWTTQQSRQLMLQLVEAVARVHAAGGWVGDFEDGNNIVLVGRRAVFVDIGIPDDDDPGPFLDDDLECLASIARLLGRRTDDECLSAMALSLDERRERRLDRRSLGVWLKRQTIQI